MLRNNRKMSICKCGNAYSGLGWCSLLLGLTVCLGLSAAALAQGSSAGNDSGVTAAPTNGAAAVIKNEPSGTIPMGSDQQEPIVCDPTTGFDASARDPGQLELVDNPQTPILSTHSPGAERILHGFEGGTVIKQDGTYYLFTTEQPFKQVRGVNTTLALWSSRDLEQWTRVSTLFESDKDFSGKSARASLWAPIPVYNDGEGRWNLFYVAYYSAPDTPVIGLANFAGRIWRAVSTVPGRQGLTGPYRDKEIILAPGAASDDWEGLQGVDSFSPFRAGGRWYSFYGTCHLENTPRSSWIVGLADSKSLAGKWKRCTKTNPVLIETRFIENPIVSRLQDGTYITIFDTHPNDSSSIGYALSPDGIHWGRGERLRVREDSKYISSTPLALIDEGNGTYTLFYTAGQHIPGKDFVEDVFRCRVRFKLY
jgi:hypothetical protein